MGRHPLTVRCALVFHALAELIKTDCAVATSSNFPKHKDNFETTPSCCFSAWKHDFSGDSKGESADRLLSAG